LSLKENIDMVKEELNSEEKFFEKAVMTEKFVKKYKNIMIASVVTIIVLIAANLGYEANEANKREAANKLLAKLVLNPSDKMASSELHTLNPKMYDLWLFSQATTNDDMTTMKELKSSKTFVVNDLAEYALADDASKLNDYASKQDAIYKDLALLRSAVLLMKQDKIQEAHDKLASIPKTSPMSKIADTLKHYGVK
jgi:hypothetical protein